MNERIIIRSAFSQTAYIALRVDRMLHLLVARR